MAKTMICLHDNIVAGFAWCSDNHFETNVLKNLDDRAVEIGDTYIDGEFYRNGIRVLTRLEIAENEIQKLESEKAQLATAYREGVNSL